MDRIELDAMTWDVSKLGDALELLARKANLLLQPGSTAPAMPESFHSADGEWLEDWMGAAAGELGIEIEPTSVSYDQVDDFIRGVAPALLELPDSEDGPSTRFLAILKQGQWDIYVLGPDLQVRRIPFNLVRDRLCQAIEASSQQDAERLFALAGMPNKNWASARRAIVRETLVRSGAGSSCVAKGWLLRLAPGASLWRQARHERFFGLLFRYLGINGFQKALEMAAWFVLGTGALSGGLDWGWLGAWGLLLLSSAACRMPAQHTRGAIRRKIMGVKQWLIYSALRLDPDAIRHQGAGQFLGCIMASGTMEDRIGSGSVMVLVAVVELLAIAVLLAFGAGGWLHAGLLLGWTAITFFIGWQYLRYGKIWNTSYHRMTSDLVERMVGHRTRLAQEAREHWHMDEDAILSGYLEQSEHFDRIEAILKSLASRGWLVVGVAGIGYTYVATEPSPAKLLMAVGGVLLASQSLSSLADDMLTLIRGVLAWQQVESLVKSAGDGKAKRPARQFTTADGHVPILMARDLVFRFRDRGRLILRDCNLLVRQGDRLLLEGPSGGGKSTLATLLAGLRTPESGLLLLKSLDRQTIGADEWRRRVVVVPQFHENHVFTETFAFNLLMGRRWPPNPEDLEMAEAICRELGLGDLIDRMPAKFEQPVGETGWQLSHGERSRLYIARALLQEADLVILDESFGTLDPENLNRAMRCVLKRAPTLMVIAHP